jgi:hypothetical protein
MPLNQNHFLCLIMASTGLWAVGCKKTDGTNPDARAFHEGFDSVGLAISKGWVAINNSRPIGATTWRQGIYEELPGGGTQGFSALTWTGKKTEYAYCDYTCAGGLATISCWLISPVLQLRNGDTLRFYTRTVNPVLYPDRLQVRLNVSNTGVDVGTDPESVGQFQQLVLDINKDLNQTDYPIAWKKYEWVVNTLEGSGVRSGRVAFRYYVHNGGPSPDSRNSDTIGLDEFSVSPAN